MNKYTISTPVSNDKKFVKDYLSFADNDFEFPCKLTVLGHSGVKHYLVDRGNIKGCSFLVLDWTKSIGE